MSISIKTSETKFSAAMDKYNRLYMEGSVKYGMPHLTKVGAFDVDLSLEGSILLLRQVRDSLVVVVVVLVSRTFHMS